MVGERDENGNPQPGVDVGKILDSLGFTRYCCRRMFLSHVDLIDKLLNYNIYKIGYREMWLFDNLIIFDIDYSYLFDSFSNDKRFRFMRKKIFKFMLVYIFLLININIKSISRWDQYLACWLLQHWLFWHLVGTIIILSLKNKFLMKQCKSNGLINTLIILTITAMQLFNKDILLLMISILQEDLLISIFVDSQFVEVLLRLALQES